MAGINLSDVLASSQKAIAGAEATKVVIAANNAGVQSSFIDTKNRLTSIGNADALAAEVAGTGQLQLEQANQHMALIAGEDMGDSMGRQVARVKELLTVQDARAKVAKDIEAKKSISLFEDPIGWIGAQLTIDDAVDNYNGLDLHAKDLEKQIDETNTLLDKQNQIYTRQKTTVTAGSIAAAAQRAKDLAGLQADQATRQAYAASSQTAMELSKLTGEQLQFQATAFNAKNAQEQLGIAQAHLALSREEFNWKKQEKEKGEAAGKYVMDTINRGLYAMDPNQPLLTENSPKFLAIIQGKAPLDGMLKRAFELGEQNRKLDETGKPQRLLGANPVEVLDTLKYRPYLSPDQQVMANEMVVASNEIRSRPEYKNFEAAKDVEGAKKYLNAKIQEHFKTYEARMDSPSNPYALPAIDAIMSNKDMPGFQQMELWKKVVAPAMAAKVDISTPDKAFSYMLAAVAKGDIKANTAALDFATVYKQAQRLNVASKQMANMGIAPLVEYNVPITQGYLSPTINLADPNAVQRAMVSSLSIGRNRFLLD